MVTMLSLLDMGDEIIIITPCFPAYFDQAHLAGLVPVAVPLKMENQFKLNIEDLKDKVISKTKMILINRPNNPAGTIFTKDDLKSISEVTIENDLFLLSDEAYSEFFYYHEHISISTLPVMRERTIIINTTSKKYSMTG